MVTISVERSPQSAGFHLEKIQLRTAAVVKVQSTGMEDHFTVENQAFWPMMS